MGELMAKAAMDTLMGMMTVFAVLILISIIIWAMGGIPKLQAKLAKKPESKRKSPLTTPLHRLWKKKKAQKTTPSWLQLSQQPLPLMKVHRVLTAL